MKIDPRRLLDLLSIARCGSFSAAAEATRTSQPGLSQSIALLERGIGGRLLVRGRNGAQLTETGKALSFYAQAMESLLNNASEEMRLRQLGVEGPLGIGITPVSSVGLVPAALKVLLDETPRISASVIEGLDDEIISILRTRELDLVVCRLEQAVHHPDLVSEALVSSDWAVITHPQHPLALKPKVSLSDLDSATWVLPAKGSSFRRQMEMVFSDAGMEWPVQAVTTNSVLAIKTIVMNSQSITLMFPGLVEAECAANRLCAIPITDVPALKPVGLVWRRDDELSPIAYRFANILRRIAHNNTENGK